MSRKANVFSFSKTFMAGMSPVVVLEGLGQDPTDDWRAYITLYPVGLTLDDLAKDTVVRHNAGVD
jgi:hypothetical protein